MRELQFSGRLTSSLTQPLTLSLSKGEGSAVPYGVGAGVAAGADVVLASAVGGT
jgi:hypothetical protein